MTFGQRWAVVVGSGLILWVISERIFWSLFRPDDLSPMLLVGIIPYTIATYCVFLAMQYFRVSTVAGVFLLGALYGWLVEGVVAMTVFGAEGIPLPFSLSWTGLSWHMLFSVVIIWWWHRALMRRGFIPALALSVGLGVFWGMWSMTWFLETPPIINDVGQYFVHALGVTALMVLGHFLMNRFVIAFTAPKVEIGIILAIVTVYFCAITVTFTTGLALIVIPALAALLYFALRQSRAKYEVSTVLMQLTEKVPMARVLTLFAAPLIATLMYGFMLDNQEVVFPFNLGVLFVTTPLGFAAFAWAWWKVNRGN